MLHALCLDAFYRYAARTCLEITAKQSAFSAQAPGLAETASAKAISARQAQWAKQLPETPADLWDTLTAFDSDSHSALFAHCASLTKTGQVIRALRNHMNTLPVVEYIPKHAVEFMQSA